MTGLFRRARPAWGLGLLLLVAAVVFPLTKNDPYWYTVLTTALVYGVLALSLDILWGYTGILNLAPAATFGVGAYAWGIVGAHVSGVAGSWLGLLAAIVVPALLAALVALISLWAGAREIYFALVTLALGLVLEQGAQVWTGVTGGSNGLLGIPWPTFGVGGLRKTFETPSSLYFMTLAAAVLAFALSRRLVTGRVGSVLAAVRESDRRAETLGYSTLRYRVLASAVSGAVGGLAGMLYAPTTGIVDPSVFGVALSVQVFVWVAVGGQGTLLGPLTAAVLISVGQQTLTGSSATAYLLAVAALFLVIVLFLPGGLGSLPRMVQRARGRRLPSLRAEPAQPVEGSP